MIELAPIILFVYNRPSHTEQTLNALMQNELADQSVLYIFADGPKDDALEEQLNKIIEVRSLIRTKKWCKEVHIIESEKNIGLADSIIKGVSEIVNRYGKVIVLEDDIVASKGFIKYVNDGLALYENEENVKSISGYLEKIKFRAKYPFFLSKGSSWGWGTWKRVWDEIQWDSNILLNNFNTQDKINRLNFSGYPYYEMLRAQFNGEINSWAIRFYASSCLTKGLHLSPPQTLTSNIGFDGSGTHCGVEKIESDRKEIVYPLIVRKIPLRPNKKVPLLIKRQREKREKSLKLKLLRSFVVNIRKKVGEIVPK